LNRVSMISAVTGVTARALGKQRIRAIVAGFGLFVAARAAELQILHVPLVVEADGELLWRKDRRARAVVVGLRARRAIRLGGGLAVGGRAQAVSESCAGLGDGCARVGGERARVSERAARCQR